MDKRNDSMSAEREPSLEEWRPLYEAAIRFKEARPWEWMTDDQIFGVENPETGEVGYVCVTGMLGEHFSLSLYLGTDGLYGLLTLAFDSTASPDLILQLPLLQASFEDRNTLRKRDREVVKQLGLRFRGRNAWPMFRSYRPGYEPWYLTAAEARFLHWGLEQGLEVALRLKEDPDLLPDLDEEELLVRHPIRREDGTLEWEDVVRPMPEPEPKSISLRLDGELTDRLFSLPRSDAHFEADLFFFPGAVREKRGERPYFPYALVLVDAASGFVLGVELISPIPSLEEAWGKAFTALAALIVRAGVLPSQMTIRSSVLFETFQPLAKDLGIRLVRREHLPALDMVRDALFFRFR